MKNLFYVAIICLATVFAVSCKDNRSNHATTIHTSQNSLDWTGTYAGILPCADCEGIQTTILLNSDNTFELRTKYLGRSFEENFWHGEFVWNELGNTITLLEVDASMPTQYLVGEGMLFQLDMEGNPMPTDVEMRYALEKVSNLIGHYWRLIEVDGNEVPEREDKAREPHFILNLENGAVVGNGGCNSFRGTYFIETGNRIRFSQMASTMMFCFDGMETETEFMRALELTDNYTMNEDGTVLSLNRARMAPLARFVLVHE